MAEIYMIFNDFNNKVYIGKAKYGAAHRWREHIGYDLQNNQYIHRSMRKHGVEHFNYKVIETNIEDECLNEREKYWIAYYNSKVPNGYNMTDGGDGGPGRKPLTKEEKDFRILCKQKGKEYFSPERNVEEYIKSKKYFQQSERARECFNKWKEENPELAQERDNKWRAAGQQATRKSVQMIDKDTNEVLNTFNSLTEAAQFFGKTKINNISSCANGRTHLAYGYKWKFV